MAVEVEVIEPVVSDPVVRVENVLETALKMVVKKLVEVALVVRRLVRVEVAVEVAVMTPVVNCPMVDEETNACGNARSDEVDCASAPHAVVGVNG